MTAKLKKAYTVLIYADGNNEFLPETLHLKEQIQLIGSGEDVDMVLEMGVIDKHAVEIIRPSFLFGNTESPGVRRYCFSGRDMVMTEELGNINMSDPQILLDFLCWGAGAYPANHYVLIMGGHVYQLVGINTDFSQDKPYIMGFPEMCRALREFSAVRGERIDLLILDTCYINMIEPLYELGAEKEPPVGLVLTYINKGPFSGLPYHIVVDQIQKQCRTETLETIIKTIMGTLGLNLIAVKIDCELLEILRGLFDDIAQCYLQHKRDEQYIEPGELFVGCNPADPWYGPAKEIAHYFSQMVLCAQKTPQTKGQIAFAQHYFSSSYQMSLYNRLAFARGNTWAKLLGAKLPQYDADPIDGQAAGPMMLQPNEVFSYISLLNPSLSLERRRQMLIELYKYKKWG